MAGKSEPLPGVGEYEEYPMKHLLILSLLVPWFLSAQSVRSIVEKGNALYEKNQFSDAEAEYKKSLEEEKDLLEGSYNLGNAVHKQQRYDEAIQNYHQAIGKTADKEV